MHAYIHTYIHTHTQKVNSVLFSTNHIELRNTPVTKISLLKEIKEERKERKKARLHFDRDHSYHGTSGWCCNHHNT
jgi:hypothetical protein